LIHQSVKVKKKTYNKKQVFINSSIAKTRQKTKNIYSLILQSQKENLKRKIFIHQSVKVKKKTSGLKVE
jgi:hypothetical protein